MLCAPPPRDWASAVRVQRLIHHIEDNLLYYHQAIWQREGSDQRFLRYKKENRRIPIEWRGPLVAPRAGAAIPTLDLADFEPTGREASLWEVIDPTGPIGYFGNYAIFALQPMPPHYEASISDWRMGDKLSMAMGRGEVLIGINEIIAQMSAPYRGDTGALRDPARDYFDRQAKAVPAATLRQLDDQAVYDFLLYFPRLTPQLLNGAGNVIRTGQDLNYVIKASEWGEYLYRKNNTRLFLVDSNNLYMNLRVSDGAALEPFKRAHRYIDVLKEFENYVGLSYKNERRSKLIDDPQTFDPDIEKVVLVDGNAVSGVGITEALADRRRAGAGTAVTVDGSDEAPADAPAPV
jgi:hypothetical protein